MLIFDGTAYSDEKALQQEVFHQQGCQEIPLCASVDTHCFSLKSLSSGFKHHLTRATLCARCALVSWKGASHRIVAHQDTSGREPWLVSVLYNWLLCFSEYDCEDAQGRQVSNKN